MVKVGVYKVNSAVAFAETPKGKGNQWIRLIGAIKSHFSSQFSLAIHSMMLPLFLQEKTTYLPIFQQNMYTRYAAYIALQVQGSTFPPEKVEIFISKMLYAVFFFE